MEIKSRPLNRGETFPCSFKQAKSVFKDTDIVLHFSLYGRDFGTFSNTPDRFFVKHNIKGKIVASMYMSPGEKRSFLSFYVLKVYEYSEELKMQFDQQHLIEFYKFYQSILCSKDTGYRYLMLVELLDNKFKIHKTSYR